jgi:hypothetical protein
MFLDEEVGGYKRLYIMKDFSSISSRFTVLPITNGEIQAFGLK